MMRDVLRTKGGETFRRETSLFFFNFKTLNFNTLNESVVNAFFFPFLGVVFCVLFRRRRREEQRDLFILLLSFETKII